MADSRPFSTQARQHHLPRCSCRIRVSLFVCVTLRSSTALTWPDLSNMSQPPDLHYPTFQLMSETFVRSLVLGELLRDGTNPELRILKNLWISGRLRSWHDREMAKAWRILGPVECCSSLPALTTYTNEAGKLELVIRISRWTSAGLCPAQIAGECTDGGSPH